MRVASSFAFLSLFCLQWNCNISDDRLQNIDDLSELALCHDFEILTIRSSISLISFFKNNVRHDLEGPSLEELAASFVGSDCYAFQGNIPKLCLAVQRQARGRADFRGRSFSQWPRPCAIYVHGTSMGKNLRRSNSQSNLFEEPHILPLPRRLAKVVRTEDAQLLANLFIAEMGFAQTFSASSRNFSELLIRLRALECDRRFMEPLFSKGNDGSSWGLIFAHSFIQDLMLGPLNQWTEQLQKSGSDLHVAILGANSGNEVFYIASLLGLAVVGYELRCDLVELSRVLANMYLPDANINFLCEDAIHANLSNAWVVILDNEAWDYNVIMKVFANLAMGPLPAGAAVVTFRGGAADGLCALEDHLMQLGWMRHAGVAVKTTWELDPDQSCPSAVVWKKTDAVSHTVEAYESSACFSEDDVDKGEDEWIAQKAEEL